MLDRTDLDVPAAVREKYGAIAKSVASGAGPSPNVDRKLRAGPSPNVERKLRAGPSPNVDRKLRAGPSPNVERKLRAGCGCGACCGGNGDPITSNLYPETQTRDLPENALAASLGCGNPTALLALEAGQTVLDLGSGGGIDVLLSARRVGPTGKVYGLDMTDEMLALARENQKKAGAANVEFLKGTIEAIPLPANAVDVVISNCVINLSTDKDAALRDAFRVLKPGGRFAVSDVVVRGDVPPDVRRNMELWIGCVAGALEEQEYKSRLAAAGFVDIELDVWRAYDKEIAGPGFFSAFIRARKPGRACCDPGCCE